MKTPHDPPQFRIVGKPVSLRLKSEGDRVHAMPRVPRRQSLPLEDVAQMAPAASTLDLYALAVRVGESTDGSRNLLVKRRPAATSVELVVRPIEGCPALLAFVRPGFGRAFVLPREGWLGALVEDHPLLGSGQRSEGGRGLGHTSSIGKPYHSLMGRVLRPEPCRETPAAESLVSRRSRPRPLVPGGRGGENDLYRNRFRNRHYAHRSPQATDARPSAGALRPGHDGARGNRLRIRARRPYRGANGGGLAAGRRSGLSRPPIAGPSGSGSDTKGWGP